MVKIGNLLFLVMMICVLGMESCFLVLIEFDFYVIADLGFILVQ